jgi:16S rRNA (guanine527-N7)-methyltransferase
MYFWALRFRAHRAADLRLARVDIHRSAMVRVIKPWCRADLQEQLIMPNSLSVLLCEEAVRHRVTLSRNQVEQFVSHLNLVRRWQKSAVRLVGSDEPVKLVREHVADAFSIYRCVDRWKGKKLIDIGSGGGFPGLCLKIVEPELQLTLLEASAKKVAFLVKAKAELALEDVVVVRGRAEKLAHEVGFREQFDLATLRAVANLPKSIETGLPFVRVGGLVVVARGRSSGADVEAAREVGQRMGAGRVVVHSGWFAGAPVRGSNMVFRKAKPTGSCYPRRGR